MKGLPAATDCSTMEDMLYCASRFEPEMWAPPWIQTPTGSWTFSMPPGLKGKAVLGRERVVRRELVACG